MKILLFGADGLVGWELTRSLAPLGDVTARDKRTVDFEDCATLRDACRKVARDVIVDAAGYAALDRAESEQEIAHRITKLVTR